MGVRGRRRQKKLAQKLKRIRTSLELSQGELIKQFDLEGLRNSNISMFESGQREPALYVLIAYADAANICLDVLIRDEYKLPDNLPCKERYHPR
jgi:transcriptional regulator with XRE-family HTH domain